MPARKVIRPDAPGPFSPGLVVDGWVYLAGQGGFDPETGELGPDVATQTAQTIENVAALLDEAGCTLKDVVSCLVHITDADHFDELNRVYESYFEAPRPVRTTVVADLVVRGMLGEITVVAKPG